MSWLKKLSRTTAQRRQPGTSEANDGTSVEPVCQGLDPDRLNTVRDALVQRIAALPVVRQGLLADFWRRGPIDSHSGATTTADVVVTKVQEEAGLIRQHVATIRSLDVTIAPSSKFDGVAHDGPEDHYVVQLARRFRNGGTDLILHHVVRTGEDSFEFGYMRL